MRTILLALALGSFAASAQAAAVPDHRDFRNYDVADAGTLVMSLTKQSDQKELTWSELAFRKTDRSIRGSVQFDVGLGADIGDADQDKLFGFQFNGKACGLRYHFSD